GDCPAIRCGDRLLRRLRDATAGTEERRLHRLPRRELRVDTGGAISRLTIRIHASSSLLAPQHLHVTDVYRSFRDRSVTNKGFVRLWHSTTARAVCLVSLKVLSSVWVMPNA